MSLFQFVDAQELCFVVMDIFRVPEILNFWTSKFLAIQTFLSEKFETVNDEDDITKQQYLNNANSSYSILSSSNNQNQSGILSTSEIFDDEKTQRTHSEKTSKAHKKHCKGPWTSTPLYTKSRSIKKTPYSKHEFYNLQRRISGLELEVCNLKKQVEILTKADQMACHENSYFLPPIAETFEPDLFVPAPPPPPPPPPPTLNSSPFVMKKKRSKVLQERNDINSHQKLDMGAILKGLKDVKLKRTERSPGGTPLRKVKAVLSDNPTDILQEALKRRFKGIHPVEMHNKENAGDSWEKSPDKKLFSNP